MPAKSLKKDFQIIEHTADIGIVAYGTELKETFANAARGMFSLITNPGKVRSAQVRKVKVNAAGRENLLVAWLNELIYLCDTENFLGKKFEISELDSEHLAAVVFGEKFDRARHQIRRGIKATTYHMLEIKQNGGYQARVIFDI